MLFLPTGAEQTGLLGNGARDFMKRGCAICVFPSADLSLASLSDISKLDCMGLKIEPLSNRWAYIAVFGLILKWKSDAIA